LGSGSRVNFAREAAKRGIQIYSLSSAFSDKYYRDLLKESWKEDKKLKEKSDKLFIAGLAQELPFKSNIFDSVLSSWAIPMYLEKNRKEYETSFREIARVLKPGGKAYLAPIWEGWISPEFFHEIKEAFKEEGIADIDVQEVKDKTKIDKYKIVLTKFLPM